MVTLLVQLLLLLFLLCCCIIVVQKFIIFLLGLEVSPSKNPCCCNNGDWYVHSSWVCAAVKGETKEYTYMWLTYFISLYLFLFFNHLKTELLDVIWWWWWYILHRFIISYPGLLVYPWHHNIIYWYWYGIAWNAFPFAEM